MKYDVWIYPALSINFEIEAESEEDAIDKAEKMVEKGWEMIENEVTSQVVKAGALHMEYHADDLNPSASPVEPE